MPTATMKLSRASKRQLRIDKLCADLRASRLALRPFRENMKKMVRLDAGADWSDNSVRLRRPYNGIALYKQAMRQALMNQTPRVLLTTQKREYRRIVATAQNWANRQFKRIKLGIHLDRAFTNALFWMGIIKVGITTPIDAERHGFSKFAGEVFAESIHPDDWVGDMFATTFEDMGFQGHRYRGTVDVANKQFRLTGENKLEGDPAQAFDQDGDERIGMIARGYEAGDDNTFRDQCDLWEIHVPAHKAILTFRSRNGGAPMGPEDLVDAKEYIGPYCGQYTYIGFDKISGQLVPKGPIANQVSLDLALNSILRKVMRQAERFKQLDLYSSTAAEDMKKIVEADDGDAIAVSNPAGVRPWVSNAPNPQLFALMLQFKQLHSQMCGNLETLLGLSRQAGTARQEELLNRNASSSVASMQSVATEATTKIMDDCCWYWWHDQTGVMDDSYKLESDPSYEIRREVGPEDRGAVRWEDLEAQVDPYSFVGETPQSKRQQLRELLNTYMPLAQFFGQQGVTLDGRAWFKKEAEYSNNPDVEELLHLVEPIEAGPGGDGGGPGMPASTNRTYTRKSESEATQGGQETDMIQQMMGAGAVGAGDFGGQQQ